MTLQPETSPAARAESPVGIEEAFQAFPRLGSPEYVRYIDSLPSSILPPEALVRAYRQLPADSDGARATLERLFRKAGGHWEYFGPLVGFARRRGGNEAYKDILQDAFRRILETLCTNRGAYAEKFWHSYCCRELSEAWRQRYGRRGERLRSEDQLDYDDVGESVFAAGMPPWHSRVEPNQIEHIEKIARRVIGEIGDEFIREVAEAAWFSNERPPVSGVAGSEEESVPLTSIFKDKSRFQIMRALRHADVQLCAALLSSNDLVRTTGLAALIEGIRKRDGKKKPSARKS
jgi:DNA-directed RNA polymerase specialized sigma24 family protein